MARIRPAVVTLSLIGLGVLASCPVQAQDVGRLLSPGPLSRAHAKLEGLGTCEKCHEPGKGVSAQKCLACHEPIAERIALERGVHREVTDDCVPCHAEHAGRDADIRPLDVDDFDHLAETGFALDGRHAALDCGKCHKTRSFIQLTQDCQSCHEDSHRGALGISCIGCHSTAAAFRDTGRAFDHSTAEFQLVGAHAGIECSKCHRDRQYRGLDFGECSACHSDPHDAELGSACSTCHSPTAWSTRTIDHSKTGFELRGLHATLQCSQCHREPATKVELEHRLCTDCHSDPHLGLFSEDCAACHTEQGFAGASFDHAGRTDFVLLDRHAEIACVACHERPTDDGPAAASIVDFRGLSTDCTACHSDPHAGALGPSCGGCHGSRSFRLSDFEHPNRPEFFEGKHATAPCADCHRDAIEPQATGSSVSSRTYRNLAIDCASCHRDVHLGQLGVDCAACHTVTSAAFAASSFDHGRTAFQLTGRHAAIECVACHKPETGAFPSGSGTAVRYHGMAGTCQTCHKDVHLGQLGDRCADCHATSSFAVTAFDHGGDQRFFTAGHAALECRRCHPIEQRDYPAGHGEAVRFDGLDRSCATCHDDVHQGTLGSDCASCHRIDEPFRNASRAFHKPTMLPLEGRHLAVPCADCHWNQQIKGTPTRCYDCHWIRRQDDRYGTRLGNECERCHSPTSWTAVNWEHGAATGYPLGGAHRTLDCEACHTDHRFEGGLPTDCVSCHLEDYQRTTDPNHVEAGFPTDCESCHRPSDTSWDQATFTHSVYPLVGTHAAQPCTACHSGGVYQGLPSDCVDCHLEDYQQTDEPDHATAGFPTDCESCHRAADPSWEQGRFDHAGYPLVGTHATLDCNSCHSGGIYQGLPADCADCHLDDYQQADDPDHAAAGFPTDCETCHRGSDSSWSQGSFSHAVYPLVGAHVAQPCNACHGDGVFQGLPSECVDCHLEDYQQTSEPDHAVAGFPTDCETCHRASDPSWEQASYDHSSFQLIGTHATLDCNSCHSGGIYQGLPSDCVDCHLEDYQQSLDPDHAAAGFPFDCELCHAAGDSSWQQTSFDHSTFQLQGAHTTLDCSSCHSGGVYQGLPSNCVDCHLEDFQQTTEPDHATAGFPTDCESCHRPADTSWEQASFDHGIWPLVGSHVAQPCNACHGGGIFQGLPSECVDCHLDDFQQASEPDHAAAGFPLDCELCHGAADPSWDQGDFDHSSFQLIGGHTTLDCDSCHSGGVYQGLPSDCVDCHLEDFQQTTDPDHAAAGFPTDCETCHLPTHTSWEQATFDHGVWPLVGVHVAQPCNACHSSGVYQGLPSDCVDCHLDDFQQATDPDHVAAGFPFDCELCHGIADPSWDQGDFDHTSFQLQGAHLTLDCDSCHSGGVYQGLPSDCVDCHLDDFQQTTDPDHATAGFPTDCETCHLPTHTSWEQATFDHGVWPLVGVHVAQPCNACHSSGVYQGLPSECVDCHLDDFQQATDPDHVAAGFPTDCELCHDIGDPSWNQGNFDHSSFQLVGVHATLDCQACHSGGIYQGLPSDCVDCHLDDYQQTTDPNHAAAGFPTDCELCHRPSDPSWNQGTFDHIWFPIDSGDHSGFRCADCHPNPLNFGIFTCTTSCHPRSEMDDEHEDVPGYIYDSPACLSCHPNGEERFGRMRKSHGRKS